MEFSEGTGSAHRWSKRLRALRRDCGEPQRDGRGDANGKGVDGADGVQGSQARGPMRPQRSPLSLEPRVRLGARGWPVAVIPARGMAALVRRLGRTGDASGWEDRADLLRAHFNRDFWMEDQDTFALALDGAKRPGRVVSSNAGQCLFSGIADPDHAARTITRTLREHMFSGWGIRTLSAQAARYNPMSYHNGSVWPHDNALIAAGFAACGGCHAAGRLLTAFFEAALMETRPFARTVLWFPAEPERAAGALSGRL